MRKYFTIILAIVLGCTVFAQNDKAAVAQSTTKSVDKDITNKVLKQLKEIFGSSYKTSIEERPDQIQFFTDFYLRCEYIPLSEAPTALKNISNLELFDKYNPGKIKHEHLKQFNAEKFNVLKYRYNYYDKKDQYFRIYKTDWVLKVNKWEE